MKNRLIGLLLLLSTPLIIPIIIMILIITFSLILIYTHLITSIEMIITNRKLRQCYWVDHS